MKSIRKFNKKKVQIKAKKIDDDSCSSDEDMDQNFWDRLKSHDKEEIASSFLVNMGNSPNIDLCSITSINTLIEALEDPEPQVIVNLLQGIGHLSNQQQFYKNLQKVNLIPQLSNLLVKFQSNFLGKQKFFVQAAVFELSAQLAELTPIEYLSIWQQIFDFGLDLLKNSCDLMVSESIFDFLSVLIESSQKFCNQIINEIHFFIQIAQQQNQLIQIQAFIYFILFNLIKNLEKDYQNNPEFNASSTLIIKSIEEFLFKCLSIRILDEIHNFKQIMIQNDSDYKQKAMSIWNNSSKAIQVSLGLLIQIFEIDDFEDMIEDDSSEEFQTEQKPGNLQSQIQQSIQLKLQQTLNKNQFIQQTYDKLQLIKEDDTLFLELEQEFVLQNCKTINYLALSYISNNLESLPKEANQIEVAVLVWEQIKFQTDIEILTQSLKLFYQLLQKDLIIQKSDAREVLEKCQMVIQNFSQVEVIILVCLDIIATRLHPKYQIQQDIIETYSDLMLNLLNHDNIMVLAQVLNSLFDVYSEECHDTIFQQKQFMPKLEKGLSQFQKIILTLKGKQNYSFLRDCCNNLKRFIQYKKQQGL